MYERHILGQDGEDFAVEYLIKNNYTIIERNFSCRQGEIDIIAQDANELVFIEVKTRSNSNYGNPIDAITPYKIKHLMKSIQYYLYIHHLENSFVRIDVIEVYSRQNGFEVSQIKGVIG